MWRWGSSRVGRLACLRGGRAKAKRSSIEGYPGCYFSLLDHRSKIWIYQVRLFLAPPIIGSGEQVRNNLDVEDVGLKNGPKKEKRIKKG
jgi:hypothetical protein